MVSGVLYQLKAQAKREGWADWIRSEADERAVMDGCWFDVSRTTDGRCVRWAAGEWRIPDGSDNWLDWETINKNLVEHPGSGDLWCQFFEIGLRHTQGPLAGNQFRLINWQSNDLLMPLFGWKLDRSRPSVRRYSKGDVFVAKKQGKSTICGGLVNGFLMKGGERAEVYGVAHSREQASIIYREAAAMAQASPYISKKLKPLHSQKRILYEQTSSFYQALAGENGARSAEGINPVLTLMDEIHVQRSRELYDALAYASAARENSLMLSVSTVGVSDVTTIWWEQYEYAKGILSGKKIDHTRFAYIRQADEACKDSPELRRDPEQWRKAMPSLGHTVSEEKVRGYVLEAENSPAKLNNLLRYVFNIPTAQIDRVIPMEAWKACAGDVPDMTGRDCYAALDIASSEDLTALVLLFPPSHEGEKFYLLSYFWCPEEKIREREHKQLAHYGMWVRDGHLFQTSGKKIDHDAIRDFILNRVCTKYNVVELPYDKWNADAVINPLESQGIDCGAMEQTHTALSAGTTAFLSAIVEQILIHDGNPVMEWCCSNAAADTRGDLIKFDKKKSADKIDGAVCGAMAFARAIIRVTQSSKYEKEGIMVIG